MHSILGCSDFAKHTTWYEITYRGMFCEFAFSPVLVGAERRFFRKYKFFLSILVHLFFIWFRGFMFYSFFV